MTPARSLAAFHGWDCYRCPTRTASVGKSHVEREGWRVFLTYLDDGGKGDLRVFGGVVVSEFNFTMMETLSALIAVRLVPPERREKFRFHASDLYNGTNLFQDIEQAKRHEALVELIRLPRMLGMTYVYSAVDMVQLNKRPIRSARWTDIAFFMCARATNQIIHAAAQVEFQQWMNTEPSQRTSLVPNARPLNLTIIDEPEQEKDKPLLRATFRQLRSTALRLMRPSATGAENTDNYEWSEPLHTAIDDIFFGNSADSVGLQVADACNWAMWRFLRDGTKDRFCEELRLGRVICAKPEPDWSENKHLFREHDFSVFAS